MLYRPDGISRIARLALTLAAVTMLAAGGWVAVRVAGSQTGSGQDAIRLYQGVLGDHSWRVSTSSPQAQAYFDQGVRLMYAYAPTEARRSFAEARRRDPSCAMCWWGEAWAMGPYLNGGMRAEEAPGAHAAAERARTLTAEATPVERALIEALGGRYAARHPQGGRRGLDSAYVEAMAGVYERFPEHAEVATLYADAMMLLEPRRGVWPLSKPSVARIHEVLEGVLARDIGHPGACHAYVHATETTPKVDEAQRCADLLGASIPGASHINHMPSHTYNRVGRWGDATRANIEAWRTDQRAARGEAFAIYPAHNLHMLLFSASVDGQSEVAITAAREYTGLVPNDGASFEALTLVRFGRFAEILELRRAPAHPVHEGLWAFARGLAHLRSGNADSAATYAEHVERLATSTPEDRAVRGHTPARLLGIVGGILRGEMLRAGGRADQAIAALRHAEELEAGLMYDEPEPLPFTARDFLGALLLESGRAGEAVAVYSAALEARPHNGWSLFGLERALRAAGRPQEADVAGARFEQAWARSDVRLTASRF
jgi:tetratricopeptide (TPR) repeat protein